jgi:hypothetical protein
VENIDLIQLAPSDWAAVRDRLSDRLRGAQPIAAHRNRLQR